MRHALAVIDVRLSGYFVDLHGKRICVMANDELKPELVDLNDWVQSGEGWNAVTYYHKTDTGLLLKLNSESMPFEDTVTEYRQTKAVYDLGVSCPATMALVTDGKRYGIITERLMGKKSFARILSENPDMLDQLARDMAGAARKLHSLPCNTGEFGSIPERIRAQVNSCGWIKSGTKSILNSCADGMRQVTTCLHGDMHPGNYLRADKGDFWIDLGRFGYGDPDMDYASQYILANMTPKHMVKWILHVERDVYRRFVELFGKYYYGDDFNTPETQERLRRAVCLALGHAIAASSPAARLVFGPYIKGHERITAFIVRLIDPLVKVK